MTLSQFYAITSAIQAFGLLILASLAASSSSLGVNIALAMVTIAFHLFHFKRAVQQLKAKEDMSK